MTPFFHSYLFAYLTVLGVPLGCLGLLQLHSLVGGAWGDAIRGILQAATDTLPWMALLFIPILIGLPHIYPWAAAASVLTDTAQSVHKQLYFGRLFFILRAVFYFGAWSWMGRRERQSGAWSGGGLVVYVFTVSFASFDWIMSLEPSWSSSIYGAMILTGDVLSGLAFAVVALERQSRLPPSGPDISEDAAHDLGNLLLTFVMLWAYMALSQYLIIWSANLPEEIGWYLARQRGGWQAVAIALVMFQFFLPFALLLARERKRQLRRLAVVAGGILAVRVIDVFWLTVPDFSPGRFSLHGSDVLVLLGLGMIWVFLFNRVFQTEKAA